MAILDHGPFELETLGHTLRVIDKDGGDVALFGRCDDPLVREYAEAVKGWLNSLYQTGRMAIEEEPAA